MLLYKSGDKANSSHIEQEKVSAFFLLQLQSASFIFIIELNKVGSYTSYKDALTFKPLTSNDDVVYFIHLI